MKKKYFFLLLCILCLNACGILNPNKEYTSKTLEKVPINPHIPITDTTEPDLVENTQNSISGLSKIYTKMKTWEETAPDFKKGMKKAAEIETTYGERIAEISSLELSNLTAEELKNLSSEIRDIVSQIREVNDLFEFH